MPVWVCECYRKREYVSLCVIVPFVQTGWVEVHKETNVGVCGCACIGMCVCSTPAQTQTHSLSLTPSLIRTHSKAGHNPSHTPTHACSCTHSHTLTHTHTRCQRRNTHVSSGILPARVSICSFLPETHRQFRITHIIDDILWQSFTGLRVCACTSIPRRCAALWRIKSELP